MNGAHLQHHGQQMKPWRGSTGAFLYLPKAFWSFCSCAFVSADVIPGTTFYCSKAVASTLSLCLGGGLPYNQDQDVGDLLLVLLDHPAHVLRAKRPWCEHCGSSSPCERRSCSALGGRSSSTVNYGHSLSAGISLAVIAHSIPAPCAPRPVFLGPRFTTQ